MINKLSAAFTDNLIAKGEIDESERELYIYGFFMFFSKALLFILTCSVGLLLNVFAQSIIFFIVFMTVRKYAGGYHAKTEARCEILSFLSLSACVVLMKLSKILDIKITLFCTSTLCIILIFLLCPLDTPEKPLTDKELKYFRKRTRIILLCIVIAEIVSFHFDFNIVFAPCCASVILEGILIVSGKIKKDYNSKKASSPS